jgi:integrase
MVKVKGVYKQRASRFYWFRHSINGKRLAVSLKTDDLSEALKRAEVIKATGLFRMVPTDLDVADSFRRRLEGEIEKTPAILEVERYAVDAQKRDRNPVNKFVARDRMLVLKKFLIDTNIDYPAQLTGQKILKWVKDLRSAGKSTETLRSYLATIKGFIAYEINVRGVLRYNPLEGVDLPTFKPKGRKTFVPKVVANKLIKECLDPAKKFLLFCGFHAGMRFKEMDYATVKWFDLGARGTGLIHIQNMPEKNFYIKDQEDRTVPMSDEFKEFLTDFLRGREPEEFVLKPEILTPKKHRYRYDFSRTLNTYFEDKGVRCTIHDMRRSFASNLVSSGKSVYAVAKWLGDGVQVTERSYGHLAPGDTDINLLSD